MFKFIHVILLTFFSFQIFAGLPDEQIFPYANEAAFRRAAATQIQAILGDDDTGFKVELEKALATGNITGEMVHSHQSGRGPDPLINWVHAHIQKKTAPVAYAEIDYGKFGSLEKLQRGAQLRAELVFQHLQESYDPDIHNQPIADAIATGSLPSAAIHSFLMAPYIEKNPLELWIKENLLKTVD